MFTRSNWLTRVLLSSKTVIVAGFLVVVVYFSTAGAYVLDQLTYAISYANGHFGAGLWTEAQTRDVIVNALVRWLPDLLLPLVSIVGFTVIVVVFQRKSRSRGAG